MLGRLAIDAEFDFCVLPTGGLLALPLSVIHSRRTTWQAKLVRLFTFFLYGTPLLVQLYIFMTASAVWAGCKSDDPKWFSGFLRDAYFWVLLGLTLNTAAGLLTIILRRDDKTRRPVKSSGALWYEFV